MIQSTFDIHERNDVEVLVLGSCLDTCFGAQDTIGVELSQSRDAGESLDHW